MTAPDLPVDAHTQSADHDSGPESLGFIGLGQIGKPMAMRWADWPGGLFVCDTNPDATKDLEHAGAKVALTPRELAEHASLISVMVRDDDQVMEVLTGRNGILRAATPGTVVAVHSTIDPRTAERLEAIAEGEGVQLVDAPVCGGLVGAVNGRLAVLVGGTQESFARCRHPFSEFGDLVLHAGPIGAGTRFKIARNMLHYVAFTAAAEAQRLAEAAGVSLVDLGKVVRHTDAVTGGPGAIMHRPTTAPLEPTDPWYPIFTYVRDLGDVDLALALDLAAELGVEVPLAKIASERFSAALGLPPATD